MPNFFYLLPARQFCIIMSCLPVPSLIRSRVCPPLMVWDGEHCERPPVSGLAWSVSPYSLSGHHNDSVMEVAAVRSSYKCILSLNHHLRIIGYQLTMPRLHDWCPLFTNLINTRPKLLSEYDKSWYSHIFTYSLQKWCIWVERPITYLHEQVL